MKQLTLLLFIIISSFSFSQEFEQVTNLNFKLGVLSLETIHLAFDEGDIVEIELVPLRSLILIKKNGDSLSRTTDLKN